MFAIRLCSGQCASESGMRDGHLWDVVCAVGTTLRIPGCVECGMWDEFVHGVGGSVGLVPVSWGQDPGVRHKGRRLWHLVLVLLSVGLWEHPVVCEM